MLKFWNIYFWMKNSKFWLHSTPEGFLSDSNKLDFDSMWIQHLLLWLILRNWVKKTVMNISKSQTYLRVNYDAVMGKLTKMLFRQRNIYVCEAKNRFSFDGFIVECVFSREHRNIELYWLGRWHTCILYS